MQALLAGLVGALGEAQPLVAALAHCPLPPPRAPLAQWLAEVEAATRPL